jgi:hypothetical protein
MFSGDYFSYHVTIKSLIEERCSYLGEASLIHPVNFPGIPHSPNLDREIGTHYWTGSSKLHTLRITAEAKLPKLI